MCPRPKALAAALSVCLAGCFGNASLTGSTGEDTPPDDTTPSAPTLGACDVSTYGPLQLEAVVSQFQSDVYPLLTKQDTGCVSCHAAGSGRLFLVTTNPTETYYLARANGYFDDKPGSIIDRLTTSDPTAKMPKPPTPEWELADVQKVADVACATRAYAAQNPTPADEMFPAQLLAPYTGPKVDYYDNKFLSYLQLKGRVKAIFNDSWVRGGVDKFAANIGLFGGVDFSTHYVEARVATPEFLLGLDDLAPDICSQAVANKTGPFTGIDPTLDITDLPPSMTQSFEAETMPIHTAGAANATNYDLYSNGEIGTPVTFSATGSYTFTIRAYGTQAPPDPVAMELRIDGAVIHPFQVPATTFTDYTFTGTVSGGQHTVSIGFTNDYYDAANNLDRNLIVDRLIVMGPNGGGAGTANATAAKAVIAQLYQRMLYRAASQTDIDTTYALLKDVTSYSGKTPDGWSGVCEALVRHPDFLFTLPPSAATATGSDLKRLMLVQLAQDLVARPPTQAEVDAYLGGAKSWQQMIEGYLASTEFRDHYFYKMRIRTESQGTDETDEPARLWTYLAVTGSPFQELLDGDYSVDTSWQKAARPAYHGKTGLLTMKGFIETKQGLPHYNYSARVITDFMGTIFEVPPEVFDMRANATAATTVDPTSICYSCHQLLTPLAYQRLRWDDTGAYRTTDPVTGAPLDDSDRGMVASYPYKGSGMEAFSTRAVKKEMFIRRTLQAQFVLLVGRDLRYDQDERVFYKQLWDLSASSNGNLQSILKAIAMSPAYTRGASL